MVGLGRPAGRSGTILGVSDGAFIDDMRRAAGLVPTDPWDLAFLHHVGWHSQRWPMAPRSRWPFPRSANHEQLAEMAQSLGLTVERPDEGDIVLSWSDTLKRYVRASVVVVLEVESRDPAGRTVFYCPTIGVSKPHRVGAARVSDTTPTAGGWVREAETAICPRKGDLVVRWTLHDGRQAAIDSRQYRPRPRGAAPWAFDEQLAQCA